MNSTATAPLVSVVVRTVGRPTLARALDSIAAQSHRPLEIVLVDAAASGIALASHRGVPVRTASPGRRLLRPHAANAGLDAARGEWISLLDEDDEIAPTHVAQLLAVALVSGAPAAYSQTRLVAPDGNTLRVFGGGPFNREALFRSNYLGTAAVLFSRGLVLRGCRFDESLDTLEDWDFWLQLSAHGDFAFSGQPTAMWRAGEGQSGAGAGGNLDRAAMLAQRERLMAKWNRKA
jgi:hypothetical protein